MQNDEQPALALSDQNSAAEGSPPRKKEEPQADPTKAKPHPDSPAGKYDRLR